MAMSKSLDTEKERSLLDQVSDCVRRFHVTDEDLETVIAYGSQFPNGEIVLMYRQFDTEDLPTVSWSSLDRFLEVSPPSDEHIVWEDPPRGDA